MKGGQTKADAMHTVNKLRSRGAGAGKRGKKAAKDPNKPKRPVSAFFVFMEEFRKQYTEEHPDNKSVSAISKAGGEKWKSMTEAEKTPYVEKAEKRRREYKQKMQAYNLKVADGTNAGNDDESDKSKSEGNDEDGSGEDEDDE